MRRWFLPLLLGVLPVLAGAVYMIHQGGALPKWTSAPGAIEGAEGNAAEGVTRENLEGILREMEEIEERQRVAFFRHVSTISEELPARMRNWERRILEAQREALDLLERSAGEFERFSAHRSNAHYDRVIATHETVRRLHEEILSCQEQMSGGLSLLKEDAARKRLQEAVEAQKAFGERLARLAAARDHARGSRLRSKEERDYEHHTYHLARAELRLKTLPKEIVRLEERMEELESMRTQALRSLEATEGQFREKLKGQIETVTQAMAEISGRIEEARKLLDGTSSVLRIHRPRVEALEQILAGSVSSPTPEDLKVMEMEKGAILDLNRAMERQAAAGLSHLAGVVRRDDPELIRMLESPAGTQDRGEPVEILEEIWVRFRRIRAMEEMMLRGVSPERAIGLTRDAPKWTVPRPARLEESARAMRDEAERSVARSKDPAPAREAIERIEKEASWVPEDPARNLTGWMGGSGGAGGGYLPGGPGGPPALEKNGNRAVPYSRLGEEARTATWRFVDHWKILGPFDNPERKNLETSYAPEAVVDLGATYPGKNGTEVRWEAVTGKTPAIMPPFGEYNRRHPIAGLTPELAALSHLPYTVYYAYTELEFDEDSERWLAIGSDDFSKLWINGQLVWTSSPASKAWRADEGYRKVRFRAGINRVLFRIENGNDRTEFSLLIGRDEE